MRVAPEPASAEGRTSGMVARILAGLLAAAALAWGLGQVSTSSGAPDRSPLLTRMGGPQCVEDAGSRACAPGIAVEHDELALSPDGKNGYRLFSFHDNAERLREQLFIYDRNSATGSLVRRDGTAGCIADGRSKGCESGRGILGAWDIEVSPDGLNAYVTTGDSVAIFARDPSTGALTQPAGAAGCITSNRKENPSCFYLRGINGGAMAISPDGLNVYVGGYPLVVFARDPATGALTPQPPVSAGAKATAGDVIVSPDGKNVYASTYALPDYDSNRVVTFDRDLATGALTGVAGRAGCIADKGQGACRRGREFDWIFDLSISPDGRNVYGTSSRGLGQGDYGIVTILDRRPDGTLSQKVGRAGCLAMFGGEGDDCASTEAISEAEDITVSADGKRIYVFDSYGYPAILLRHPSGLVTDSRRR